jgi:hypothetical protein
MAATPSTPASSIEPAFKRVQQDNDFDCAFACIATITGKSLEEVRQIAIKEFEHPKHGPYWITEDLICKIFANLKFVCTVYKEVTSLTHLPDVCVLMIDYVPETEIGRHVVYVRDKRQKPAAEYVIDVAYWIDPSQHVRTDVKALKPAWYLQVHPMAKSTA